MRSTPFFFSFSCAVVIAACGSSSGSAGNPIDCNWLAGSNCYKATVSATSACLPDSTTSGALSADGKTCTYPSGQVITFDPPVMMPLSADQLLHFTLTSGGTQCLKVDQGGSGSFTVTTTDGTFASTSQGGVLTATCPDGSSYSVSGSNALALLSCDGGGTPPSTASGSGTNTLQFWLGGLGTATLLPVFDCHSM
jgi:hypothetical protein